MWYEPSNLDFLIDPSHNQAGPFFPHTPRPAETRGPWTSRTFWSQPSLIDISVSVIINSCGAVSGMKSLSDGGPKGGQDVEDGEGDLALGGDGPSFLAAVLLDAGREAAAVADDVALDQQVFRVVHQRVRRPRVVFLQVLVPHLHVAAHPHRLAHRPRPRHPPDEALAVPHEFQVWPFPGSVREGRSALGSSSRC